MADNDAETVASAARHMDDIKPGWWRNIDPIRLDLGSGADCICGQNGLDWDQVSGLAAGDFLNEDAFADSTLEPYWLEEIAKRMSPAIAPSSPVPVSA